MNQTLAEQIQMNNERRKVRWLIIGVVAVLLNVSLNLDRAKGQAPQDPQGRPRVIDSMVATVNGNLITYSDLLWQLTLEPQTILDNPNKEELRRALELVIRQRIIHHEAERLPHIHATEKEVELALAELVKLFPSQAVLQQRMRSTGLTSEKLREIISERVDIEKYLNFRFRSFTVVTAKEVADFYRTIYVPRFRQRSPQAIVPTLEEVRTQIEKTLTESKVEADLQRHIDELRDRAEIVILTTL